MKKNKDKRDNGKESGNSATSYGNRKGPCHRPRGCSWMAFGRGKSQKSKLIGIVTTNDFFYKIVNKILGLGEPGLRILIKEVGEDPDLEKILSIDNKHNLNIITLLLISPLKQEKKEVIIHFY